MNLILLGPPGAGKGTLAAKATSILGLPHISTGEIFRSAIAARTELGLQVKSIIEAGKLVDDAVTVNLVRERLTQPDAQKGYIMDGFPRTIPQAQALAEFSSADKAINFDIPDAAILERLGNRRVCRNCGANFNVGLSKPKVDGVCDHCNGELYMRDDDRPEIVQKRLEVYRAQTAPLIDYYRGKGILVDMDAGKDSENVVADFRRIIGL
jgi:adenylate kinase